MGDAATLRYARDVESYLTLGGEIGAPVELAGLITRVRQHGGVCFATLRDPTGAIQLVMERGALDDDAWEICPIAE